VKVNSGVSGEPKLLLRESFRSKEGSIMLL
jgi:hypothetical protein